MNVRIGLSHALPVGGVHLVLLAHAVVAVAEGGPSGHGAEGAAVCQIWSPPPRW